MKTSFYLYALKQALNACSGRTKRLLRRWCFEIGHQQARIKIRICSTLAETSLQFVSAKIIVPDNFPPIAHRTHNFWSVSSIATIKRMQNRIKSRKIKPAFLTSTHAKITLEGEEKEKIKEQLKREEGINQGRYLWATDWKIMERKNWEPSLQRKKTRFSHFRQRWRLCTYARNAHSRGWHQNQARTVSSVQVVEDGSHVALTTYVSAVNQV